MITNSNTKELKKISRSALLKEIIEKTKACAFVWNQLSASQYKAKTEEYDFWLTKTDSEAYVLDVHRLGRNYRSYLSAVHEEVSELYKIVDIMMASNQRIERAKNLSNMLIDLRGYGPVIHNIFGHGGLYGFGEAECENCRPVLVYMQPASVTFGPTPFPWTGSVNSIKENVMLHNGDGSYLRQEVHGELPTNWGYVNIAFSPHIDIGPPYLFTIRVAHRREAESGVILVVDFLINDTVIYTASDNSSNLYTIFNSGVQGVPENIKELDSILVRVSMFTNTGNDIPRAIRISAVDLIMSGYLCGEKLDNFPETFFNTMIGGTKVGGEALVIYDTKETFNETMRGGAYAIGSARHFEKTTGLYIAGSKNTNGISLMRVGPMDASQVWGLSAVVGNDIDFLNDIIVVVGNKQPPTMNHSLYRYNSAGTLLAVVDIGNLSNVEQDEYYNIYTAGFDVITNSYKIKKLNAALNVLWEATITATTVWDFIVTDLGVYVVTNNAVRIYNSFTGELVAIRTIAPSQTGRIVSLSCIAQAPNGDIILGGKERQFTPTLLVTRTLWRYNFNVTELIWAQNNTVGVTSVAVDWTGDIYTAGPRSNDTTLTEQFTHSKWSKDGLWVWSRDHGADVNDIAVDEDLNVYIVGEQSDNVLPGNMGPDLATHRKYNALGNLVWSGFHGATLHAIARIRH